ncbi:MAG: hypothetical protein CMJ46_08855 [Planctomyces sp.]|nr:hypothetical protein [Planctomyces sp.]
MTNVTLQNIIESQLTSFLNKYSFTLSSFSSRRVVYTNGRTTINFDMGPGDSTPSISLTDIAHSKTYPLLNIMTFLAPSHHYPKENERPEDPTELIIFSVNNTQALLSTYCDNMLRGDFSQVHDNPAYESHLSTLRQYTQFVFSLPNNHPIHDKFWSLDFTWIDDVKKLLD